METPADSLRWQLRLTTPKITSLVQNVHHEISCLDSFSEIRQRFTHTVFVRLSDLDRYLVEAVLLTPSPIIDLSKDNEQEIDEISRLLFLRWSWADAVLRHVLARLLPRADHDHPGCVVADAGDADVLAEELSVRHGGRFPGDTRQERVEKLIGDELNEDFFLRMRQNPCKLSQELDNLAVAPHPDDIPIWRLMARQVADRYRPCLRWPRVHFAAAKAGSYEDGQRDLFEYPFYEEWWNEALSTVPSETSETCSEASSAELPRNGRIELERDLRAVFDASDVWDVWSLCRMRLCEEALWGVDQEPGTERDFARLESMEMFNKYWIRKTQKVPAPARNVWDSDNEYLQRRHTPGSLEVSTLVPSFGKQAFFGLSCLPFRPVPPWPTTSYQHDDLLTSYLALRWYAPIAEPKEWFFFGSYGNYDFRNITDPNLVSGLLENAELDPQSQTWDLVCMSESNRDQKDRVSNIIHIMHTIYVADDMQGYCYLGLKLPGLIHPCDCQRVIQDGQFLEEAFKREKRKNLDHYRLQPEHYTWDHRGGNLVFNRRKLEDTEFYLQQNDCFLIRGLGYDDELDLIDPDTIYVLETLPGIKYRQLKAAERQGRHEGLETADRPSSK
ncbi:hypothetical protein QBC32DRAFT_373057 [Pseudoneurospora amorphoporcata]|uniref:Uncharacterized protein n=1 Tax=Pseudoneurospora amorphoporcata TaxID=241081 RepID=A0AAN6NNI0_9PEZI|nr:hypothetical protein QBC32DRAFT_373057 [Pseudoneurospora amorphoporcata]